METGLGLLEPLERAAHQVCAKTQPPPFADEGQAPGRIREVRGEAQHAAAHLIDCQRVLFLLLS